MKSAKWVILLVTFVGLVGIQFATLIDDPQHLIESDPNCPLCVAAKTEVYISPPISISFTPDIVIYLVEKPFDNPEVENYASIISIRAPPSL